MMFVDQMVVVSNKYDRLEVRVLLKPYNKGTQSPGNLQAHGADVTQTITPKGYLEGHRVFTTNSMHLIIYQDVI